MKTKEQMLHFIMEAAGECVHEAKVELGSFICSKCGLQEPHIPANPSPDDMNKLMSLLRKLKFDELRVDVKGPAEIIDWQGANTKRFSGDGNTAEEALLNALFVAKGGLEDDSL